MLTMKVLLKRDIKGLGKAGEVKTAADGYAANYLLPRGLAVPATDAVIKDFEAHRRAEAKKEAQDKAQAGSLGDRLAQTTLTFTARAGEQGKLFGSITGGDIASGLEMELGEPFDKRKVMLEQPIREVGKYKVPIRLMGDVVPEITVVVKGE
jgi:large subunit ribosomal protein L9